MFLFFCLAFLYLINTKAYPQVVNISLVDSFVIVDKPNKDIFNFQIIPFEEGLLVEYIESRSGCRVKISDSLLYFNIKNSKQSYLHTPKDFRLYSRFNIMDFSNFLSTQNLKLVRYRTIGKILKPLNVVGTSKELGVYKIENDTLKIRPLKKSNWAKDFYEWNNQEIIVKFSDDSRFIYKGYVNKNYKLKYKKFIDLKKSFPELDIKQYSYFNYIKDKNLILLSYAYKPQIFCYNLENKKSYTVNYKHLEYSSPANIKIYYSKIEHIPSYNTDWYYQIIYNNDNSQTTLLLWKNDLNQDYESNYTFLNEFPLLVKQDKLYTYCYTNGKLILKMYNLFE